MADLKRPDVSPAANPLFLRDGDLRSAMELLYFAYRRFTGEADTLLKAHGYGRAHHRVLYFVGQSPGLTVGQLLDLLQITKQSLGRVLRVLVHAGLIEQRRGDHDGRERHLTLTPKGASLEAAVAQAQIQLLRDTFLAAPKPAGCIRGELARILLKAPLDLFFRERL